MKHDPYAIYMLYRATPPERRGVTVIQAYWSGYDGTAKKYTRNSLCWWAQKAGQDNLDAEVKSR